MSDMETIRKQSTEELTTLVRKARETIREERFKDKFSRKAGVIRQAKQTIARALTELRARAAKPANK